MGFRKTVFFIFNIFFLLHLTAGAQEVSDLVSLSGVVVDEADLNPIPNVTIKNTTRGAASLSDSTGFFYLTARPGDTLIFEAMLYSQEAYIVPEGFDGGRFAVIEAMHKDKVLLEEVMIQPFPTELQFQHAFMSVEPGNIADNMVRLDVHVQEVTDDPTNMKEYILNYNRHYATYVITRDAPPNNFLNPERWAEFISDWREGRFSDRAVEKMEGLQYREAEEEGSRAVDPTIVSPE